MDHDLAPAWGAGALAGIIGMVRWLFSRRASRVESLEELVDLLRRKLDESLTRGNAATTMARILLFAVDQERHPSAAMIAAREQAREVIAAADAQLKKGS
jgi:hypothetical protein